MQRSAVLSGVWAVLSPPRAPVQGTEAGAHTWHSPTEHAFLRTPLLSRQPGRPAGRPQAEGTFVKHNEADKYRLTYQTTAAPGSQESTGRNTECKVAPRTRRALCLSG